MKHLPYIAIIVALVTGCGPSFHLKQAKKHILKAEAMGAKWGTDTVWRELAVPIESVRLDTLIVVRLDTVKLEKERLKIEIKRLKGDTVFVQAECRADTIRELVPMVTEKRIEVKTGIPWYWLAVALIAGALGMLFIRR